MNRKRGMNGYEGVCCMKAKKGKENNRCFDFIDIMAAPIGDNIEDEGFRDIGKNCALRGHRSLK